MSVADQEIAAGIQRLTKHTTFEYDITDVVRVGIRVGVESQQLPDDPGYHQAFRKGFEVSFHGYVMKLKQQYSDYDFILNNGDSDISSVIVNAHNEYFENLDPNSKEFVRLIKEENLSPYQARQIVDRGMKPSDPNFAVNTMLKLIRSKQSVLVVAQKLGIKRQLPLLQQNNNELIWRNK